MVQSKSENSATSPVRKLRILLQSNAPWSQSGYGVFAGQWLKRLKADGWPIAFSSFTNFQGTPQEIGGVKFYGNMDDQWGSDALVHHAADWQADVVISFQDVPPLNGQLLSQLKHWVPYVPVDREPASAVILNNLRYAYKIVTISNFGKEQLANAGFTAKAIVEGTDVNIFKPIDKKEARKKWGLPEDKFIVYMIGANKENPPRKGWQEGIDAFKQFSDKHPEAILLANFQQQHIQGGGFPIQEYVHHLGLDNKFYRPNDYKVRFNSTSEQQNELYNCSDMLLHPSQTEGFGLCIVEAMSAGKPVVIQDCHSMPELIVKGRTGFAAKTLYKQFKGDLSYWYIADPTSVYAAMEKTFRMIMDNPEKVRDDCHNHIVEHFNIDKIYKEQWVPFLEGLQTEILG